MEKLSSFRLNTGSFFNEGLKLIFVLQGDQRENICRLLVQCGLVKGEQLKVHGF